MRNTHPKDVAFKEIVTFLIVLVWSLSAFSYDFAGGTGEPNDPYQIATAEQLLSIGSDPNLLNKCYILLNDIDLDPNLPGNQVFQTALIGSYEHKFIGVFDGNSHSIKNLVIKSSSNFYLALFHTIGAEGTLKNLIVENAYISGRFELGSIAVINEGKILFCGSNAYITGEMLIGCFATINAGQIKGCYSTGRISGQKLIGGLVCINCYNNEESFIESSYSSVNITAQDEIGGLVCVNRSIIKCCYSSSIIYASSPVNYVGGLAGNTQGSMCPLYPVVYQSYWDIQTSGILTSFGGDGKTTEQMKSSNTYRGWGYEQLWKIDDGNDYPRLIWENVPGTPIIDDPNRYYSGDGTEENPYQIKTPQHLSNVGFYFKDFNSHFVVVDDINMAEIDCDDVLPIGTFGFPFTGVFDGNGHTIHNFKYNSEYDYVGFFGYIECSKTDFNACPANVKNVHLRNSEIHGNNYVGGLVGFNRGAVYCSSVDANVYGINNYIGGFSGINNGIIKGCFSEGYVDGSEYVGGFSGNNYLGSISSCYSSADVNCYWYYVGGFVGNSNMGQVMFCYSNGHVKSGYPSGFTASLTSYVYLSYWDMEASGVYRTERGYGKTTEQMMDICTFKGWGHDGLWKIDNGNDYPRLIWEDKPGQLIVDNENDFTYGTGAPDNPYQIKTAEQLRSIPCKLEYLDKHFVLMNDIDCCDINPNCFIPIGTYGFPFTGSFDGNSFTISNLTLNYGHERYIGMFGYIEGSLADNNNVSIKNLHLQDSNVTGKEYTGTLVGYGSLVNINDCSISGTTSGHTCIGSVAGQISDSNIYNISADIFVTGDYDSSYMGGVIGNLLSSSVKDCQVSGTVIGYDLVGGLAGEVSNSMLTSCSSNATIQGRNIVGGVVGATKESSSLMLCSFKGVISGIYNQPSVIGGLIGGNAKNSYIDLCFTDCNVSGYSTIGGMLGSNGGYVYKSYSEGNVQGYEAIGGFIGSNSWEIHNCYSTCMVTGYKKVGGLAGKNFDTIFKSYSTGSVSGDIEVGGFVGYTNSSYLRGFWDFETSGLLQGIGKNASGMSIPYLIGKLTEDMQTKSTFTDVGWDFVGEDDNGTEDIWRMCVDGVSYPKLSWEFTSGDLICPDGVDFLDFAFFADRWFLTGCDLLNNCQGCDLDLSGQVDSRDLKRFIDNWLEEL